MTLDALLDARIPSDPGFHLLMPGEYHPRASNGRPDRTAAQWPPRCTRCTEYTVCTVLYSQVRSHLRPVAQGQERAENKPRQ